MIRVYILRRNGNSPLEKSPWYHYISLFRKHCFVVTKFSWAPAEFADNSELTPVHYINLLRTEELSITGDGSVILLIRNYLQGRLKLDLLDCLQNSQWEPAKIWSHYTHYANWSDFSALNPRRPRLYRSWNLSPPPNCVTLVYPTRS